LMDSWAEDANEPQHGLHGSDVRWTVNGVEDGVLEIPDAGSSRMRFVNVANAGYLELDWPGTQQVAAGQGVLAAPKDTLEVLVPGDRLDLERVDAGGGSVDVTAVASSPYGQTEVEPAQRLMTVTSPTTAPATSAWAFSGATPTPDPLYTDIVYSLQGDVSTDTWAINGEQFPDITPYAVPMSTWQVIEVRNISFSAHPFHMHGLVMEVLSVDEEPPAVQTMVDTFNVGIAQTVRFGVLADNEGEWMTHCHILPHAEGGMMTVLVVAP